jgi:hypothetical protein
MRRTFCLWMVDFVKTRTLICLSSSHSFFVLPFDVAIFHTEFHFWFTPLYTLAPLILDYSLHHILCSDNRIAYI